MKIEMLAAKHGDCLLLHYGPPENPGLILIDGGPAGVWKGSLEPRLMALRTERELGEREPLQIDLLIISHVDDDHINGVLGLLRSMHARKTSGEPPLFRIGRLWHNSFDTIIGNDETVETLRRGQVQFGPASNETLIDNALRERPAGKERDAALVLASIAQGDDVRRLANALGIPINPDFGAKLIQAGSGKTAVQIADLELMIAGPLHDDLVALQREHDAWLKDHPERRADPGAILAALADSAIANLSSIAVLARSGGKTALFTGDARADKVLEGLEASGVVVKGESLALDVLKMPHHGSIRNVDGPTLERLPAHSLLFSGNGKFLNPDRETFELLFQVHPGASMDFVLAYRLDELEQAREREVKKKGRAWNPAKDGLRPILSTPPPGVRVVENHGIAIVVEP